MAKNFKNLGISSEMTSVLNNNGITEPTPIQVQAIKAIMKGKDVIAQAQTGTGKTLAFMLPIMENIDINKTATQALIVTPTRELAIQITNEAKKLIPAKEVNILAAYGGQDVEQQIRKLKNSIHLVIGTPGRLLDHIRRRSIDLSQTKLLVLDEADVMFHMGFLDDVEMIINQTSKSRQTMSFSATMPEKIRSLASRYMKEPVQIHIESSNITLDEIKQIVIETNERDRRDALIKIIEQYRPYMGIIFCRTKRRVSALNEALQNLGYLSDELHGDLTQGKREKVMNTFRKGKLQFLVATDVAARGLDIEGITHVFNYDIAHDAESYIHRIGRTGRAGQKGIAVTFVTHRDRRTLDDIERGIKSTIKKRKMDNEKEAENKYKNNENKEYKTKEMSKTEKAERKLNKYKESYERKKEKKNESKNFRDKNTKGKNFKNKYSKDKDSRDRTYGNKDKYSKDKDTRGKSYGDKDKYSKDKDTRDKTYGSKDKYSKGKSYGDKKQKSYNKKGKKRY